MTEMTKSKYILFKMAQVRDGQQWRKIVFDVRIKSKHQGMSGINVMNRKKDDLKKIEFIRENVMIAPKKNGYEARGVQNAARRDIKDLQGFEWIHCEKSNHM